MSIISEFFKSLYIDKYRKCHRCNKIYDNHLPRGIHSSVSHEEGWDDNGKRFMKWNYNDICDDCKKYIASLNLEDRINEIRKL